MLSSGSQLVSTNRTGFSKYPISDRMKLVYSLVNQVYSTGAQSPNTQLFANNSSLPRFTTIPAAIGSNRTPLASTGMYLLKFARANVGSNTGADGVPTLPAVIAATSASR